MPDFEGVSPLIRINLSRISLFMIQKLRLTLFAIVLALSTNAQTTKYTVSGIIKDKKTGETAIGATLRVKELTATGVVSNEFGFYSITLPAGTYTFIITYLGYTEVQKKVVLDKNQKLDVQLEEQATTLNEVVVSGEKKDAAITNAKMGVEKLDIVEISKIPVLFGEKDILKTIQLLPGIKGAGEGNSGFYVRGGSADQNLILLDDAPVYNASHLLGFFSTFNSLAIQDVEIYKGLMPAQYGTRLSSTLDIKMKNGNDQKFHVAGGIGTISTNLAVEGPIVKNKGSFLVTARRTYADVFLKLSTNDDLKNSKLYFYDLNLKSNYNINDKNRIFLSAYFGRDVLGAKNQFGLDWGNATATLRWNHIINDKLFSNTSFIFSDYNYKLSFDINSESNVTINSKIRDYNFKQEFQYFLNPQNKIRAGINIIHHTIIPGQVTQTGETGINAPTLQNRYAIDNAIYIDNNWTATDRINVDYGLRLSGFNALGGGDFYTFDAEGNVTESTYYGSNQVVANYYYLEPRITASYRLNKSSSVKTGYARTTQNLHLISNSTTASPTDLWIPSSLNTKAEIGDQVSLGYFKNLKDNQYEVSAEAYYKLMQNQVDYKNGANTIANDKIEGELLYGKGQAYGLEILLKKKFGRFNGWIGYTLSKSERLIDGINDNKWYNAKQDRTNDVSVVGIYELSKKWSFSATWVYTTGAPVTYPTGKYTIDDETVFAYQGRNSSRMPNYHRLDIGATFQARKTEKYESSWNFSIYNAYARANAYSISFKDDPDDPTKTQAVQTTLFKLIPSISYNFKF